MTLKEIREQAKLSLEDLADELGVEESVLEAWEQDESTCQDFVLDLLKDKLVHRTKFAQIRYEESFSKYGIDAKEGYSVWLKDKTSGKMKFSCFFTIKDGNISVDIMNVIGKLITNGYKVVFI